MVVNPDALRRKYIQLTNRNKGKLSVTLFIIFFFGAIITGLVLKLKKQIISEFMIIPIFYLFLDVVLTKKLNRLPAVCACLGGFFGGLITWLIR